MMMSRKVGLSLTWSLTLGALAAAGCAGGGGTSAGASGSGAANQLTPVDPLTGAVFTTDSTCTQVNGNIYDAKTDVFLDGGPKNKHSAGLPDGMYYYEITDPGCTTLLAGPFAPSGIPDTSGKTITVVNGAFTTCLQLAPFNDTPNPGGEYKVHVTPTGDFDMGGGGCFGFLANDSKTDNFKVRASVVTPPGCTETACVSGMVVNDMNGNCQQDDGETALSGVTLHVILHTPGGSDLPFTTTDGTFMFCDLIPGEYSLSLDTSDNDCLSACEGPSFEITCGQNVTENLFAHVTSTPLKLECPGDITKTQSACGGCVIVFFEATTSGGCGDVDVVFDPPSRTCFDVGTTIVHVTATDELGDTEHCQFQVTILPFTP
jgi:hypothetical protein